MWDLYLIPICVSVSLALGYGNLTAIQLNNYYPHRISVKSLIPYVASAVAAVICTVVVAFSSLAGAIVFAVTGGCVFAYITVRNISRRTHYKFTHRATRLFILYAIITLVCVSVAAILFESEVGSYAAAILSVGLYPWRASLAAYILMPFERANNKKYIEKTRRYIASLPVVTIGITGSYGKTSCKNILAAMLSVKYKVIKTEGSYNTPLGICKTMEKYNGERVFIAEMGAKRRGDIRELCELTRPKYAIITGVAPQHLESFGSVGNVARTKFELAEAIPSSGFIVFNGDNVYTRDMGSEVRVPSVTAGYSNGEYRAENVRMTAQGSKFDLICGDDRISVETCLLGRHNVLNIVLCAALARRLGISLGQIAEAVRGLTPVPHRLEVRLEGDITIIDDGYNANIEGVGCAFEVLAAFSGRKVVYTQGIVDAGRQSKSINRKVGALAAAVADVVILSGENSENIAVGLKERGFEGKVYKFKGLREAEAAFPELLRKGDVLLIQNDIP